MSTSFARAHRHGARSSRPAIKPLCAGSESRYRSPGKTAPGVVLSIRTLDRIGSCVPAFDDALYAESGPNVVAPFCATNSTSVLLLNK